MLACILRTTARPRTRNKGVGGRDPWLWVHALPLVVAGGRLGGRHTHSLRYLARRCDGRVDGRQGPTMGSACSPVVNLDHQQQAAILYIWSQTFPESGNLSPDRGRFGRLVPQGAEQDKPDSCLSGCCLASHWHGSLYPGPQLRVRRSAVVLNIWASSEQGCCLIVSSAEPLSGLALRLAIDQLWQSDWGLRVEWCPASAMALRMCSEK